MLWKEGAKQNDSNQADILVFLHIPSFLLYAKGFKHYFMPLSYND